MQDDVHEGYHIPKGSLVIPNIWSARKLCIYLIDADFWLQEIHA